MFIPWDGLRAQREATMRDLFPYQEVLSPWRGVIEGFSWDGYYVRIVTSDGRREDARRETVELGRLIAAKSLEDAALAVGP